MRNAARNEIWRRKDGLWTVLSATCDDAAKKCYHYIAKIAEKIADIDTCNVHTLKSIATSVNLSFLVKGLHENFPFDIEELINTFSVPPHILLHSDKFLHEDANNRFGGMITRRRS